VGNCARVLEDGDRPCGEPHRQARRRPHQRGRYRHLRKAGHREPPQDLASALRVLDRVEALRAVVVERRVHEQVSPTRMVLREIGDIKHPLLGLGLGLG